MFHNGVIVSNAFYQKKSAFLRSIYSNSIDCMSANTEKPTSTVNNSQPVILSDYSAILNKWLPANFVFDAADAQP